MKKVSIITILDNTNFGTYLQAYALCKIIEHLGAKPELVDYWRPFMTFSYSIKQNLLSKKINIFKCPLRIFKAFKSNVLKKQNHQFLAKYLTKKIYISYNSLIKNPPEADVYMTGSDQVWNSFYNKGIDRSFYLDFAPTGTKRFSYAASIGMSDFPENEKKETLSLLKKYSLISVREDSAREILIRLGINSDKIFSVLDPTLLLSKQAWSEIIPQRMHEFKYLLLYSVESKGRGKVISELARNIAKKRGLKIVSVYYGDSYWNFECSEYNHYYATPQIFLSLLYYADFVIVSSFHGTAFSINFQKDFISVAPDRFNSRVTSLLNLTGLTDRLVNTSDIDLSKMRPIDYNSVTEKLKDQREKSIQFINSILNYDNL